MEQSLGQSINRDMRWLYKMLKRYDYETIKNFFDTVYGKADNKCFDFETPWLCGTIENRNGEPYLTDLQFTRRHLGV